MPMWVENTLFGGEIPGGMSDDGPNQLSLGCPFTVDRPGRLAGFSYYGYPYKGGSWLGASPVDHWGTLRNAAGDIILFTPFERSPGAEPAHTDAWRHLWIHPRFTLEADTPYTLIVWFLYARYGYFSGRFDSPWTHDHLAVPRPTEGDPAGRYVYGASLTASLSVSTAAYAVDVIVETAA